MNAFLGRVDTVVTPVKTPSDPSSANVLKVTTKLTMPHSQTCVRVRKLSVNKVNAFILSSGYG